MNCMLTTRPWPRDIINMHVYNYICRITIRLCCIILYRPFLEMLYMIRGIEHFNFYLIYAFYGNLELYSTTCTRCSCRFVVTLVVYLTVNVV